MLTVTMMTVDILPLEILYPGVKSHPCMYDRPPARARPVVRPGARVPADTASRVVDAASRVVDAASRVADAMSRVADAVSTGHVR
jgi:hypothetical protein